MRELKLLIAANTSMFALSLIVAAVLFWLNAGPVWMVVIGTMAGIAAFMGTLVFGDRYVNAEVFIEEDKNA